ncbi:MAG: hypothetical protein KI790_19155 [Cyclobacteriaceae bacterium]|nr:hypothetical protein [Cyclobacteriaceae bacterium HetDA_MAG_MS6]
MITIKKVLILQVSFFFTSICWSQEVDQLLHIEDRFDLVASDWLEKSGQLKTYVGVNNYCASPSYRSEVDDVLGILHHYDSTILSKMNDPQDYLSWNPKEEKKTLKDIAEMQETYGVDNFVEQMRKTCSFRNEIEQNAEDLRSGVGAESYDAKILVLETELRRYLNKIDRLVLRIDDHLHVLHID